MYQNMSTSFLPPARTNMTTILVPSPKRKSSGRSQGWALSSQIFFGKLPTTSIGEWNHVFFSGKEQTLPLHCPPTLITVQDGEIKPISRQIGRQLQYRFLELSHALVNCVSVEAD